MFRSVTQKAITQAVAGLQEAGKLPGEVVPEFSIAVPDNPAHGDYSSNIAFGIAKSAGRPPSEIAEFIAGKLEAPWISAADAAGGFLNVRISDKARAELVLDILAKGARYGDAPGRGEKIQVEFISANPTGPLTLANGRGGFLGDVLSGVLSSQGYEVEREYYVNDAGNQIRTLGLSLLAAAGMADGSEDYYRGDYIAVWAAAHADELRRSSSEPEALGRLAAADFLSNLIRRPIEEKMRVRFDRWTSEYSDLRERGYVERAIDMFRGRGLTYVGDGATWLKTTDYGDDKDRVLLAADGDMTYLAADAGHYLETKERGFAKKILIVGADHHGYVARLQAVAGVIGLPASDIIVMQLVRLMAGGSEVRMSKRKGVYVTIEELINEVGLDAARYFFLEKNPETHIDFNLDLAKKRSKENPVYYIQYACARLASLARKGLAVPDDFNPAVLGQEQESRLAARLLQLTDVLEDSARDYRVSRLTRYVYDLAHAFHLFYDNSRILDAAENERGGRAALAGATDVVLKKALGLLGISSPEEM